jgi:hypothetical protein
MAGFQVITYGRVWVFTEGFEVPSQIWDMNVPAARSLLFCAGTASNQRPTEIEKQLGKRS